MVVAPPGYTTPVHAHAPSSRVRAAGCRGAGCAVRGDFVLPYIAFPQMEPDGLHRLGLRRINLESANQPSQATNTGSPSFYPAGYWAWAGTWAFCEAVVLITFLYVLTLSFGSVLLSENHFSLKGGHW